jgi:hypothetical protein
MTKYNEKENHVKTVQKSSTEYTEMAKLVGKLYESVTGDPLPAHDKIVLKAVEREKILAPTKKVSATSLEVILSPHK